MDDVTNKRAWVTKQSNNKYDFAVLGSSRAFGSFDMKELNALTNKSGVNIGADGSGYVDNYITLYLFLKNRNRIDSLFLQVDIYSLNSKMNFSNAFHVFHFLPYWKDSLVRDCLLPFLTRKDEFMWDNIPAVRYFTYNKYFSPKEILRRFLNRKNVSPFDENFGGPSGYSEDDNWMQTGCCTTTSQARAFDNLDVEFLEKIIGLCEARQIKLIAYKAPELASYRQSILNYDSLDATVDTLLRGHGLRYIKSAEIIEGDLRNFKNPTHLSGRGRQVFTRSFAGGLGNP